MHDVWNGFMTRYLNRLFARQAWSICTHSHSEPMPTAATAAESTLHGALRRPKHLRARTLAGRPKSPRGGGKSPAPRHRMIHPAVPAVHSEIAVAPVGQSGAAHSASQRSGCLVSPFIFISILDCARAVTAAIHLGLKCIRVRRPHRAHLTRQTDDPSDGQKQILLQYAGIGARYDLFGSKMLVAHFFTRLPPPTIDPKERR
jgi:hypothetical protein